MDMNNIAEDFAAAIEGDMQDIPFIAKNLELSRKNVWFSVAQNEEEQKAIADAKENFEYTLEREGCKFSLNRKENKELPVVPLLEEGKKNPLTGGQDGMVTHLDGSKTKTKVPLHLQGYETNYGWNAMPVIEETQTMLEDLMPDMVRDRASNSSAGAEVIKDAITENLHLRGGS